MNLSYTSISQYKKCPKQFWYQRVAKQKPPVTPNVRPFITGDFVAKTLEACFKFNPVLDKDFARKISPAIWEQVIINQRKGGAIVLFPNETMASLKSKSFEMLDKSIDVIKSYGMDSGKFSSEFAIGTYAQPLEVAPGVHVIGNVDWMRDEGSEFILCDFKTSNDLTYIDPVQALIYVLAVEKITGKPVRKAFFLMLKHSTIVNVTLTPERREETKALLTDVNNKINSGVFPATPTEKACKDCLYKSVCPDSVYLVPEKSTEYGDVEW